MGERKDNIGRVYNQLEQTYSNEKRSNFKDVTQKFRDANIKYQDILKRFDEQFNEIKKSSMPRTQGEIIDRQARGLNLQNYDTVNKQKEQLIRMNKTGEELVETGHQIQANLSEQNHVLSKANDDEDALRGHIIQGKIIATRISNREFCYKLALFILGLLLTAADVGIAIYVIQKEIKKK